MSYIEFTTEDDDGNEIVHRLPARWTVCENCDGDGTTVNPSIDGNGLSREDFEEDPDFAEDYCNGVYDVPCAECFGTGKVLGVEADRIEPAILEAYYEGRRSQRKCDRYPGY